MGSLILCHKKKAKHPYEISRIHMRIYTIEELCYYFCNNLYLVDYTIINRQLCDWLEEELEPEESIQLGEAQAAISLRLGRTGDADIPLLHLFQRCGLDAFEQNCVILAYAAVLDRKYEKLLAYLQDDMTRKSPGTALAVQLFMPKGGNMEQYLARFTCQGRFSRLFEREALARGELVLHPLTLEYLSGGTIADRQGMTVFDGAVRRPDGPLIVQGDAARRLEGEPPPNVPEELYIPPAEQAGERIAGRRTPHADPPQAGRAEEEGAAENVPPKDG